MILLGKRFIDFTNPKGETVKGVRLTLAEEIPLDSGEGFECQIQFISSSNSIYSDIVSIPTDTYVDVYYNKYGKVSKIICKEV